MRLLLLLPLFLPLTGCSLFYENTLSYDDFSLHGNDTEDSLRRRGDMIQRVFDAYRILFPEFSEEVSDARVLYEEDALSQESIFTGDLRQEGYYLPALDLIHLSPRRLNGDADDLSVILHEMGHHFLISARPRTSSRYWLNEGFACCLEVSYFDTGGDLVTPLFHLSLYGQARQLLREQGRDAFRESVAELLDASWFRFHRGDGKNHHYAYSWILYWHLLRTTDGSLEERVQQIEEMPPEAVVAAIDGAIDTLRQSPDSHLEELARDPRLRGWSLDQWAELPLADGRRFLRPLLAEIESEGANAESWARATRLINGRVRGLSRRSRSQMHQRVARTLAAPGTDDSVRIAIAAALEEEGSRSWSYMRPLVTALESENPSVRSSSARALARLSRNNPTVVNPSFWRDAPPEVRAVEVDQWQRWLARMGR